MKKGEKFMVSSDWWAKGQPKLLGKTGLGEALRKFETVEQKFIKKKSPENFLVVLRALSDVDSARKKAISKCGVLHAETKAALEADGALQNRIELMKKVMAQELEGLIKKVEEKYEFSKTAAEKLVTRVADLRKAIATAKKEKDAKAIKTFAKNLDKLNDDSQGTREAIDAIRMEAAELNTTCRQCGAGLETYASQSAVIAKAAIQISKQLSCIRDLVNENGDLLDLAKKLQEDEDNRLISEGNNKK